MNPTRFHIEYGASALHDLESLPRRLRKQIVHKIERLEGGLHGDIKRLRGGDVAYRLRAGAHRILFDIEGDVVVIRRIGDRKNVYD